jgi:uncharacterized coiled-coil DUF342 family protein
MYEEARRLAEEFGRDVEEVLLELRETKGRIARDGVAAEDKGLAAELDMTPEEVRAEAEAVLERLRAGEKLFISDADWLSGNRTRRRP